MTTQLNSQSTNSQQALAFTPPIGLRSPHLQTVLSSIGPRKRVLLKKFSPHQSQMLTLTTPQGVRLQGFYNQIQPKAQQLVVLLHGWEGCHESSYMLSMTNELLNAGYAVFRLNLRDHGGSHHLNRELFASTLLDEVVHAIVELQTRLPYPKTTLGGFSLGGNFALRIAAKAQQAGIKLDKCVAFCPVIHAKQSNDALRKRTNLAYQKYFVRKWKKSLKKKIQHFPQHDYLHKLNALSNLDEMNHYFVPKYTGFNDINDYFDAYSITGDTLNSINCPCYLHFSQDDMIIPIAGVAQLPQHPKLNITITKHGGHCGFLSNWKLESWQDARMLQILQEG